MAKDEIQDSDKSAEVLRRIDQAGKAREVTLDLSDFDQTSVPPSIFQLTQLQSLDLSGNHLTQLPKAIGRLAQLQFLDLDGNQLTQLPESIVELKSLRRLFLHGNEALNLPAVSDPQVQDWAALQVGLFACKVRLN